MIRSLEEITELISGFPGIGRKSAQRIAFFLLRQPSAYIDRLSNSLKEFHDGVEFCSRCGALKELETECSLCAPGRDQSSICVVEQPSDAFAIERSGDYRGLYHILMGSLSPLDGVGPEDIRLAELFSRAEQESGLHEIIIATNPNVEGNATANYIASRLAQNPRIKISRIATGLPLGSQLEYSDSQLIAQSIKARTPMES